LLKNSQPNGIVKGGMNDFDGTVLGFLDGNFGHGKWDDFNRRL